MSSQPHGVIARHRSGTDPEQFGVTPDGARLYASNEDAGTASATDLRTGRVLATLVVGNRRLALKRFVRRGKRGRGEG